MQENRFVMPILDSSNFVNSDVLPARLQCDICIIGSGPAGITIARELSGTALRVTLLESGGWERQEASDALNEIESVGWPRVMDQWAVRNRLVGEARAHGLLAVLHSMKSTYYAAIGFLIPDGPSRWII